MATSQRTKNCRLKLWLYRAIDWLLLFTPIVVYVCIAVFNGGVTTVGKIAVVGTVAAALILSLFNIIAQKRLRCPIWIVLIGLYIAMQKFLLPLVIILAVITILDDLVLVPLIDYYKTALISNKQIDEREEEETQG